MMVSEVRTTVSSGADFWEADRSEDSSDGSSSVKIFLEMDFSTFFVVFGMDSNKVYKTGQSKNLRYKGQ